MHKFYQLVQDNLSEKMIAWTNKKYMEYSMKKTVIWPSVMRIAYQKIAIQPKPQFQYLHTRSIALSLILGVLTACGGSSSNKNSTSVGTGGSEDVWRAGVFRSASVYADYCENPRVGVDPITNDIYPDLQGKTKDENNWLRSITNDLYLWYDEVPDLNPALYSSTEDYFDLLVTNAVTSSGAFKDQFHFTYPTEEYFNLSRSGISAGYGVELAAISRFPPREIVVAYTQPNSPAANAGITRGARIISVDGELMVNGNADILNAGLSPKSLGEPHVFEIQDLNASSPRTVTLTSQQITLAPVQNVKTIVTPTGNVGYLTFNEHIETAEQGLIDAVNQLAADNITDLVVDLRYNGGGRLYIASQLAYMIAGSTNVAGRDFETLVFNDKHPTINPVTGQNLTPTPFYSLTTTSTVLPQLNLDRVFILSSADTCSASESIINGLRGIDVDVYQIGTKTCGKPYGFYEMPNCGTSYFTIMFSGENAKGFGDYADGFAPQNTTESTGTLIPGCTVADDFTHLLGDESEAKLAGALSYRAQLDSTGSASCSAISSASPANTSNLTKTGTIDFSAVNGRVLKPKALAGKIL